MSRLLTIGQVVKILTPEFEDLSITKVRYLEDQDLVHPVRTPSGYRKYSEDDVRRLRYILTAQRDRYLPLRVIRAELDRLEAGGADGDDAGSVQVPDVPTTSPVRFPEPDDAGPGASGAAEGASEPDVEVPDQPAHPPGHRTLRELAEHLDVEVAELRELRDNGLIGQSEPYGPAEQRIARWAVVLLRDGLEARHLRMYVQFVDREVTMVEQLVRPLLKQRNPEAHARARLLASDLGEASTRLHGALLSRALEAVLE